MNDIDNISVDLAALRNTPPKDIYTLNQIVYGLDREINLVSSHADSVDYLVAMASGVLCSVIDILWTGDFDLVRGRCLASDKIEGYVHKIAKKFGCNDSDLSKCVKFLEDKFPIPSDGNTPDFGGGLQHHLRDFAHHPTVVGLVFSMLTQFTGKSYGTDVTGAFIVVDVPEYKRALIGQDIPQKIMMGTVTWFFHLVSDMAGSSATCMISGGTGIPGPLLSLAKELSVIPFFRNLRYDDATLPQLLSKLFNGTLLAKRDGAGKIIKETVLRFDLRAELGIVAELGRQALPILANECIVRLFYLFRRLAQQLIVKSVKSPEDLMDIQWKEVLPFNNPTVDRMLLIASGVFSSIDLGHAILSQKYLLAVNYVGVGRFIMAIGKDVAWGLRRRDLTAIREMYLTIRRNTFTAKDSDLYNRIGHDLRDMLN